MLLACTSFIFWVTFESTWFANNSNATWSIILKSQNIKCQMLIRSTKTHFTDKYLLCASQAVFKKNKHDRVPLDHGDAKPARSQHECVAAEACSTSKHKLHGIKFPKMILQKSIVLKEWWYSWKYQPHFRKMVMMISWITSGTIGNMNVGAIHFRKSARTNQRRITQISMPEGIYNMIELAIKVFIDIPHGMRCTLSLPLESTLQKITVQWAQRWICDSCERESNNQLWKW